MIELLFVAAFNLAMWGGLAFDLKRVVKIADEFDRAIEYWVTVGVNSIFLGFGNLYFIGRLSRWW